MGLVSLTMTTLGFFFSCFNSNLINCPLEEFLEIFLLHIHIHSLKKYDYNIDMDMKDHIATLPKKGLKKYDYNIDMDMKDHIATLPKKGIVIFL